MIRGKKTADQTAFKLSDLLYFFVRYPWMTQMQ